MTERAGIYGSSLYDLAVEEGQGLTNTIYPVEGNLADVIYEQLLVVKGLFRENPDYLKLLCNPAIKKAERLDLIEQAFGTSCERYLVNFLKLLCERNLLGEFEGCCETYKKRYNSDHNIAEAIVTSAVALSDVQAKALKIKLEGMSGKKVNLITKIDARVVAGIKVELDGVQFDGTVDGRMNGMLKKLSEVVM